jgi:hypothetical protein
MVLRIALVLLVLRPLCRAETLVVDLNGGGGFTDIQSALNAAADGDTVLVMPGEYLVDYLDFNRLHDPEDPDSPPVKDLVLCSKAGPEETVIGNSDPESQGWEMVVFRYGETRKSVLRGFTITGGGGRLGGAPGVHCFRSSPVIEDCILTGNNGGIGYGGGFGCCCRSSPILKNCIIKDNWMHRWDGPESLSGGHR